MMAASALLLFSSCEDHQEGKPTAEAGISAEVLASIQKLGFSTQDVHKVATGYVVEGDILLTDELLRSTPDQMLLRTPAEEQYRTINLVSRLPRTLIVKVDPNLPAGFVTATNEAIRRFNALNMRLKFRRVSPNDFVTTDIYIQKGYGVDWFSTAQGHAGFPSGGNPYNDITMNPQNVGTNWTTTVASIIAHEMGHCIGFRHSDYMSRQYTCGGTPVNEGASGVGAIHIPGTPTGPSAGSWMSSCIALGANRPFNSTDITALRHLYQ